MNNISFSIIPDSRILVQGESGSGKSSLLKLITGIISSTQGNIYLNEININNLFLNKYRSNLGLSLSEETPFEGSIRENIIFGNPDITEEKLHEVINNVGL